MTCKKRKKYIKSYLIDNKYFDHSNQKEVCSWIQALVEWIKVTVRGAFKETTLSVFQSSLKMNT